VLLGAPPVETDADSSLGVAVGRPLEVDRIAVIVV